eukprot:scaffold17510_cov184-Amphora_coffeaeformis.AAC.2
MERRHGQISGPCRAGTAIIGGTGTRATSRGGGEWHDESTSVTHDGVGSNVFLFSRRTPKVGKRERNVMHYLILCVWRNSTIVSPSCGTGRFLKSYSFIHVIKFVAEPSTITLLVDAIQLSVVFVPVVSAATFPRVPWFPIFACNNAVATTWHWHSDRSSVWPCHGYSYYALAVVVVAWKDEAQSWRNK